MRTFLLLFFVSFLILINHANAQITGTVFRDNNCDGVLQQTVANFEIGIPNIIINAYDGSNTVIATTTSAVNGTYTLPFTVPVRVEFEMPAPSLCVDSNVDFSSNVIAGENIRFVNASTPNVDYGIQNPQDYIVTANPEVFVTQFNRGDPLLPGTSASASAIYGFPYSSSTAMVATHTGTASQVGSIWGLAYSKQANRIFAAAFLKRMVGLGPLGSGGIYKLEPFATGFNAVNFYDMDANGHRTRAAATAVPYGPGSSFNINAAGTSATYIGPIDPVTGQPEGWGVIGVNGAGGRGLTPSTTDQWNDPAAMDQIAKVGLGDIDISEDGKFLFVMNLYDRKLYRLELDNAYNPQSVIAVTSYSMPAVTVTNGVLRGFGLAYHRGKVYIGAVSTGENGGYNAVGAPTVLNAYVFELNNPLGVATMNATPVITYPLNYLKGAVIAGSGTKWNTWSNNTDSLLPGEEHWPSPILSDIEFSDGGDMIMDFCDRMGHQFAPNSRRHLTGTTMTGSPDIGGDVLIAGINCGTGNFTLENNGSVTSNGVVLTGGTGNSEGPGGGEFFFNDEWGSFHHETSVGSCAVLRGRKEVLVTLMDPVNAFSNGSAKFSTVNAANTDNMHIADMTEFGKGNSLGDLEVAGDAALLQIGNRVWEDDDADGIQDPGEIGINNVDIELYADFNNDNLPDGGALATTNTATDGNWYFDKTNVVDGDPATLGVQAGPVPGKMYLVRIGSGDWSGGKGANDLLGMNLTLSHIGGFGQPDVRDNDGDLVGNIPTINAQTFKSGQNIHSYDFGFIPCPILVGGDIFLDCNVDSALIGPAAVPGNTYTWSPPTGLSNAGIAQPTASPSVTTTYTLTVNDLCFKQYTAFVDNTPPNANAGPAKILDCSVYSVVIGTPAIAGYTYSWSPAGGLNDPNIAQPTASPIVTTTYTLTVLGTNGCIGVSMTTVNLDKCCARVEVPNSFTPNGDGLNDEFGAAIVENVESYSIAVYNRYGQRVFESDNPKFKWNGKYNDKDCDLGTYFYMVKYDCSTLKEPKFLKGDVTLLR